MKQEKSNYFVKSTRLEEEYFEDNAGLEEAVNVLVYGSMVTKFNRKGSKSHQCFFYLHENDNSILQWISPSKNYHISRLHLSSVVLISKNPTIFNHKKSLCFVLPPQSHPYFYLSIMLQDASEIVLEFREQSTRNRFWQGLQFLTKQALDRKDFGNPIANLTNKLFVQADLDGNQKLSKQEVQYLLNKMKLKVDEELKQEMDYRDFQVFVLQLMAKNELKSIFDKYLKIDEQIDQQSSRITFSKFTHRLTRLFSVHKKQQQDNMSLKNLQCFFSIEQQQNISLEELQLMVDNYGINDETGVSLFTFANILFNDHNSIIDPNQQIDMSHPLTDYYIYSSHNTYLMANQLTGLSSVQAYRNAFQQGCKSVEIDCWDGATEPVVTHGHTLTSNILFKDVIQTIKEYGFIYSPYPVIISLELHCSPPFQRKMAAILQSILKEQLYTVPSNWKDYSQLPSPQSLIYKVIIKGKGKLSMLQDNFIKSNKKTFQIEDDSDQQQVQLFEERKDLATDYYSPYLSECYLINLFQYEVQKQDEERQRQLTQMNFQVEQCLFNCYGLIGKRLKLDDPPTSVWQVCSLDEDKINLYLNEHRNALIKLTTKNLLRIYPKAARIYSSNYSTLPCFLGGAQLVALNMQTNDDWFQIYKCQFQGSNTGYLLKPPELRKHTEKSLIQQSLSLTFTSQKRKITDKSLKQKKKMLTQNYQELSQPQELLVINFISGQQLAINRSVSPFLQIELKGMPIDEELNLSIISDPVKDNGFNPIFNMLVSFTIFHPWFATILIKVNSKKNSTTTRLAQIAVPVRLIRNGYRIIRLENEKGKIIDGSYLFVQVKRKQIS